MLDKISLKIIASPLNYLAKIIDRKDVVADQITISGFLIGLFALPAIFFEQYILALVFILINRLFDGLDGALARIQGETDSGGFLDITLDFIFYSLIPFAFILSSPDTNAIAGAFLIFSFIGTGSSFLAFGILAGKRGLTSSIYPNKSIYYITGLTEGTETILTFVLICLYPAHFALIAYIFGGLCWVTTISRIWFGYHKLQSLDQ